MYLYLYLFLFGLFVSCMFNAFMYPRLRRSNTYPHLQPTLYPILYRGMIHIPISTYKVLHIHHWLLYALVILSSFFYEIPPCILGFSVGLCIHGLLYKDAFQFIKKRKYA